MTLEEQINWQWGKVQSELAKADAAKRNERSHAFALAEKEEAILATLRRVEKLERVATQAQANLDIQDDPGSVNNHNDWERLRAAIAALKEAP